MKRERRLFYACSLTALAVHVLARTTGLFNNNAVAYKPTIMIFMDMIQAHDGTWQPGNHVATIMLTILCIIFFSFTFSACRKALKPVALIHVYLKLCKLYYSYIVN